MWICATVFTDPAGGPRGWASLGAFYAAASERIQLTQPLPRADRPLFKLAPACCSGLRSDFLLHDIDTGDGIVQTPPEDTANKLRTAALWGLRVRPRYLHDLKSLTLESAIDRHGGEVEEVRRGFHRLSESEKEELFRFLNSL